MDSIGSLGYLNGFEYVRIRDMVFRADYANGIGEDGLRRELVFVCMFDDLPVYVQNNLSDSEGNPCK